MAYNLDLTILMLLIIPVSFLIEDNLTLYGVAALIIVLYHALFESSSWQATPGKRQGDLKVQGQSGERITFLRACCRILAKFLSLLLFFAGFFMIYLRSDRKGLHDLICNTSVKLGGGKD